MKPAEATPDRGGSAMNRIERVRRALAGQPVDHPPFTVWYHFGLQHAPAERTARAHLEFFDTYDLDWVKVMNDYSYPMPPGVETLSAARDLARLTPLDPAATPMGAQLEVIGILARELGGRVHFLDTVFDAWNTVRRSIVKDAMGPLMREHPAELEAALAVVNDNLIRYARASLDRGASGIFLSVPASEEFLSREQYERFMRPFDLALLEAVRGRGEWHVLHAHGENLYFEPLLEYPVQAISWADREGGPSLGEARRRTRLPLMGGIAHGRFAFASAASVRHDIRSAVAEAGLEGLFLAPGCALATYAFPELIRVARDESRRAGAA
jgi:uroporphyrinogen decarboxylase